MWKIRSMFERFIWIKNKQQEVKKVSRESIDKAIKLYIKKTRFHMKENVARMSVISFNEWDDVTLSSNVTIKF